MLIIVVGTQIYPSPKSLINPNTKKNKKTKIQSTNGPNKNFKPLTQNPDSPIGPKPKPISKP